MIDLISKLTAEARRLLTDQDLAKKQLSRIAIDTEGGAKGLTIAVIGVKLLHGKSPLFEVSRPEAQLNCLMNISRVSESRSALFLFFFLRIGRVHARRPEVPISQQELEERFPFPMHVCM